MVNEPSYDITVITVTHNRPELLLRAMRSLQAQDYAGNVQHLILVDGCPKTMARLDSLALPHSVSVRDLPRADGDRHGCERLSKIRNLGVSLAQGFRIAFLDDDNEFEPNHLSSLLACAQASGCPAVHSHRQMFDREGRPYLEQRSPWQRDPKIAKIVYTLLCGKGIFVPGSNLVRDRADVYMVDLGSWLFEKKILLDLPFPEEYSYGDWQNLVGEDDKLLRMIVQNKIPVACTQQPTLKYYLGGFSNAFEEGKATSDIWQWKTDAK